MAGRCLGYLHAQANPRVGVSNFIVSSFELLDFILDEI